MLQDCEGTGEITREVFLLAWQGLPSLRGEVCFLTRLYRIIYHCCLRQLERRKRERFLHAAIQTEQILMFSGITCAATSVCNVSQKDLPPGPEWSKT